MNKTASAPETGSQLSTPAYQLHVELHGSKPKVWRRLLVPTTVELPQLHVILLLGMGWEGGELHEFVFGHDSYGPSEPGLDFDDMEDEEGVTLDDALAGRRTFTYIYHHAWTHKVKVEGIVKPAEPVTFALCIDGEHACPSDDLDDASGNEQTGFDLAEVNRRLTQIE
jgi:hypothetical protein